MKTSNNYISAEKAKTLLNEGGTFIQTMSYKKFFIIDSKKNKHKLNEKNATIIKEWLKNKNK